MWGLWTSLQCFFEASFPMASREPWQRIVVTELTVSSRVPGSREPSSTWLSAPAGTSRSLGLVGLPASWRAVLSISHLLAHRTQRQVLLPFPFCIWGLQGKGNSPRLTTMTETQLLHHGRWSHHHEVLAPNLHIANQSPGINWAPTLWMAAHYLLTCSLRELGGPHPILPQMAYPEIPFNHIHWGSLGKNFPHRVGFLCDGNALGLCPTWQPLIWLYLQVETVTHPHLGPRLFTLHTVCWPDETQPMLETDVLGSGLKPPPSMLSPPGRWFWTQCHLRKLGRWYQTAWKFLSCPKSKLCTLTEASFLCFANQAETTC